MFIFKRTALLTFALFALVGSVYSQNLVSKFGVRDAYDFAYGINTNVPPLRVDIGTAATGSGTITLNYGFTNLGDATILNPINVNAPITIGAGTNVETVTPSAVSCSTPAVYDTCTVTATFTYLHGIGDTVRSGTVGLQEALNVAAGANGGLVAVTAGWYKNGGTAAILAAATTSGVTGIWNTSLGTMNVGSLLLQGSCSGTATASSTLGLYGLGEFSALACTSTTVSLGQVMNRAGILKDLSVTATTGGVSSSSGVFTVLKNNAATTLTCTTGTAASCTDTTHTAAFVVGDVISIEFTTQGSETLAGVKGSVEAF